MPTLQLLRRNFELDPPRTKVDVNAIAVAYQRERSAIGRLRHHLTDDKPAVETRELAVGNHRDGAGKPGAIKRCGETAGKNRSRPAARTATARSRPPALPSTATGAERP